MNAQIHSFETAGTVDGPGLRFVLFLHGCPLRCRFCHNPDTWASGAKASMSASEILSEVEKYSPFFKMSGGGVTISGGEPLMQPDFLSEFLALLKSRGIHSAVDTCGYTDITGRVAEIVELADMFLLDVKHVDARGHIELTGRDCEKPRRFLDYLCEKNKRIWIRCVLVNGITAEREYAEKLGEYLRQYGGKIERVELLPYHRLGVGKWRELGLKYSLEGVEPTSPETVAEFKKILRGYLPTPEIL